MLVYTVRQEFRTKERCQTLFLCSDYNYSTNICDALLFSTRKSAREYIDNMIGMHPACFRSDFVIYEYSITFVREISHG